VKSKYCSNHKPQPCRLQGQRHTPHNRMQSFNQWTYNVQNIIGLHYWVYCLLHVNIIEVKLIICGILSTMLKTCTEAQTFMRVWSENRTRRKGRV